MVKLETSNPQCCGFEDTEVWTFIEGEWEIVIVIESERRKIKRGEPVIIPVGMKHLLRAITQLSFIEVQMGTKLKEEDIERFDW